MLSFAYKVLTDLGAPAISLYLLKRRREGREDPVRFKERLGEAGRPRPEGRVIWCHAASVGEATSLMTLIEKLLVTHPKTHILVTTGTVTSARMLEGRLPPRVIHQYVPVDRAIYVKKFLDHWQPDFVLWIESELWPNMLAGLKLRLIPAILLNGRMSQKSFRQWYRVKGWAQEILSTFVLCMTQTEDERTRFVALGAKPVRCLGNLKYAANPLACDELQLLELKQVMAGRLVWVMASSHRGEETLATMVHEKLTEKWPQLLTIIVPRHASRGEEIAASLKASGRIFAQRSKKEALTAETEIYLCDTMGELGLFYRLSPIAAIGGSFVSVGGHNPIEAAQLGCAVVFGPYMHNFLEMAREFTRQQAAIQLQNANELAFTINRLLSDPNERTQFAIRGRGLADQKRHVLDQVLEVIEPWLSGSAKNAA